MKSHGALLVEIVQPKILSLIKKILAKDRTLSAVLENYLPPTAKRFKFSNECQMRELAEGLQPKNTTNS